ncbi:MAG: SdrD B-like domain-containing protein [Pirellulaceae bacterium]
MNQNVKRTRRQSNGRRRSGSQAAVRRVMTPEKLEARQLLAADPIHVGVVYLETDYLESDQDVGADSRGDRFILSFTGGAPDTELTELRITTDKDGDGITVGDPIYDTAPGGRGKDGSHGFQIVRVLTSDGRSVDATAEVEDGGQELVLRLSNFRAGDRLEFSLDVDEVLRNAIDLAVFNNRLDVITSGQEFQDSILDATFEAPHYETSHADAVFENDFGSPNATYGLNLPPDEGTDIDSRANRSAAAVGTTQQLPKPVSISGHVWIDNDLDLVREFGEPLLAGIEVSLWQLQESTGRFVDTGHRSTTDANGRYEFSKLLALAPGQYQVAQSQPAGLFSVGAVPGEVDGVSVGKVESVNVLTNIIIPLGDQTAVDYDFAEAAPASITGFVYQDDSDDGIRDANEKGIAGVTIRLVPINTIAPQATLTVTTSADGSYAFTGLAPGQYEVVEVSQPANLTDGKDTAGTVNGKVVGIANNPGDRLSEIFLFGDDDGIEYNFGELALGSIAGFVYLVAPGQDCTGDHDAPGNRPLAGVQVELQTFDGITVAEAITRADGGYFFDDVPRGNYRIVEFTPAGLLDGESHTGLIDGLRVGNAVDGGLIQGITLTPGGTGVEYNFCEAAPATISGNVYEDNSDDGVRDAGEDGIAGVLISLVDDNNVIVATTTTDANGHYVFTGILPGQYSLVETQPVPYYDGIDTPGQIDGQTIGQRGSDGDSLRAIPIRQGQIGTEYNFGELLGATLSGQVHVDLDDDCLLDTNEETLSGVVIRLIDSSGVEVDQATTDTNGRYTFENIKPGEYTVIEEQPEGYFDGGAVVGSSGGTVDSPNRISKVTLSSGEVAVDYNFCENPPAEILGNVFNDTDGDCIFDAHEVGIAGVKVELFDGAGNLVATTTTDASGSYQFSYLRAGSYTVRETQPAGWLQGGQVAGSHGGDASQQDVISRIPVGWGERLTQYNFCEVEPSSISGFVYVDGNGDCLRDPGEPPLAGVTIELRDAAGNRIASTLTDANGKYLFDNLAPGDYSIFEQQPDGYFQGGQMLGSGGGVVLGDDHLGVTLGSGSDLVNYDFCELGPSSIEGKVWQETDFDQKFGPGESPIPGVLIELIDAGGDVVATTQTDDAGCYRFDELAPGVYSIRETQPGEFFHGGEVVGSEGGDIGDDDLLIGINLQGGVRAVDYNFPEVPPATISGYVFQDGTALELEDVPNPEDLREYRDGAKTADDVPIEGVQLELRNILGTPFEAANALPGVYPDGPIRVTTNADGYYEFTGLRPGAYHVYEIQPQNYIDSLDTPGTRGGLAVNPADAVADADKIVIQTLAANEATNPRDDAILSINVVAGGISQSNNFSEIIFVPVEPPEPPTDFLPIRETITERPLTPIETFDPRINIVTYAAPEHGRDPLTAYDEWAVTWHLSVINGGFPRGTDSPDGLINGVSAKSMQQNWDSGDHVTGRWTLMTVDGKRIDASKSMTLGEKDATALTGDFDGDGSDEAAIYAGGQWFVDLNGNGVWDAGDLWIRMGTALDRPVVGDWDGDGKDDIAIFGRQWQRDPQRIKRDPGLPDPDNKRRRTVDSRALAARGEDRGEDSERLLRRGNEGDLRADAVDHVFKYGEQVDTPIAGDWNGDGIDQIAVFRSGVWLLDSDGDGRWTSKDTKTTYGNPGDEPIVGDFNGDGIDEIGVIRGDMWIIDTDGDRKITGNDLQFRVPRANGESQPIAGDWDGDGKDDPGYYDEAA